MEAKDIIGLVLSAVAVLIAVVAVVVSWRIAKKQDEQQRLLARRQHIDGICKDLVDHLTTWHDQLRAVVKSDDAQGFERYIDELEAFQATKAQIEARIGEFVKNEKFEGPLETHLVALQAFPETDRARDAVWRFQQTALVFKESQLGAPEFEEMLTGHGHWADTKLSNPRPKFPMGRLFNRARSPMAPCRSRRS